MRVEGVWITFWIKNILPRQDAFLQLSNIHNLLICPKNIYLVIQALVKYGLPPVQPTGEDDLIFRLRMPFMQDPHL